MPIFYDISASKNQFLVSLTHSRTVCACMPISYDISAFENQFLVSLAHSRTVWASMPILYDIWAFENQILVSVARSRTMCNYRTQQIVYWNIVAWSWVKPRLPIIFCITLLIKEKRSLLTFYTYLFLFLLQYLDFISSYTVIMNRGDQLITFLHLCKFTSGKNNNASCSSFIFRNPINKYFL